MNRIIFIVLVVCSAGLASAQGLVQSTEDSALVEVTVQDFKDRLRKRDCIIFEGKESKITLQGITNDEGRFRILLPEGDEYTVKVKGLGEDQEYNTFKIEKAPGKYALGSMLIKYEPAKSFTLQHLEFESGKSVIKPGSEEVLLELIDLLNLKAQMNIEIAGYTDDVGDEKHNLKLSQHRADAVKHYLVKKGIASDRLLAKGYGEADFVAGNETEEERQKNRRTEVHILSE